MLSSNARRQQAQHEIERLVDDFDQWEAAVQAPQYTTQLKAIASEVRGAAILLQGRVKGITADSPSIGDAYGSCVQVERQITWLWRVYLFYREKFDQREDDRFRETLHAADQVTWSCFRAYFDERLDVLVPEPVPLPYITDEYSPMALRRSDASVLISKNERDTLAGAFGTLPVPLLKLPIGMIANPWCLNLIGHEIGHVIMPLVGGNAFVQKFREALVAAGGEAGKAWGPWAVEIFCDWYGLITTGPWIIWTFAQFEVADMATMTKRRGSYPSPLVRLQLMSALANRYGLSGSAMLQSLGISPPPAGLYPDYDSDTAVVCDVANAIFDLPECAAVVKKVGFVADDFAKAAGLAAQWANYLRNSGAKPDGRPLRAARLVAAAAAETWNDLVFAAPQLPADAALEAIRQRTRAAAVSAGAPGVRASSAPTTQPDKEPGTVLLDFLTQAAEEDLRTEV